MYSFEDGKEIGNGSVKLFVALYKGLPIELEEDSYLFRQAISIITENNENLTEEIEDFLQTHSISLSEINNQQVENSEEHESEIKVNGQTTFREVMDWGISQEVIEEIIGDEMPNPVTLIRDYCTSNEIGFSGVKEALQNEVDELK